MAKVITGPAPIQCPHNGTGIIVSRQPPPLLTIAGMPALVALDAIGVTISGCTLPKPCTKTVTVLPAGIAIKLQVQGKPVLLANASGATDNGSWSVVPPVQTKLDAI